jgi:hypothetical protein
MLLMLIPALNQTQREYLEPYTIVAAALQSLTKTNDTAQPNPRLAMLPALYDRTIVYDKLTLLQLPHLGRLWSLQYSTTTKEHNPT